MLIDVPEAKASVLRPSCQCTIQPSLTQYPHERMRILTITYLTSRLCSSLKIHEPHHQGAPSSCEIISSFIFLLHLTSAIFFLTLLSKGSMYVQQRYMTGSRVLQTSHRQHDGDCWPQLSHLWALTGTRFLQCFFQLLDSSSTDKHHKLWMWLTSYR